MKIIIIIILFIFAIKLQILAFYPVSRILNKNEYNLKFVKNSMKRELKSSLPENKQLISNIKYDIKRYYYLLNAGVSDGINAQIYGSYFINNLSEAQLSRENFNPVNVSSDKSEKSYGIGALFSYAKLFDKRRDNSDFLLKYSFRYDEFDFNYNDYPYNLEFSQHTLEVIYQISDNIDNSEAGLQFGISRDWLSGKNEPNKNNYIFFSEKNKKKYGYLIGAFASLEYIKNFVNFPKNSITVFKKLLIEVSIKLNGSNEIEHNYSLSWYF